MIKTLKSHEHVLDLQAYPEDFSPCHRRILSARAITHEQLQKPLSALISVNQLLDAKLAATIMYESIQQQKKIVIVGDYDADGATAMSVMLTVLDFLNARYDSVVPNRLTMGYGLSDKAVQEAINKKAELVITVDNGITAIDSVNTLKSNGIDVIITDHHLPAKELPNAQAIVNPNRADCDFPSKCIAGVGVAFYVILALRQVFRENDDTRMDNFPVVDLLPYVAIGTVADVVALDYNNRILVEQGLKRIRAKNCPLGITALIDVARLNQARLTASNIGFQIAPRLNAAGRIADMRLGVDCLLCENERLATDYALELDALNRERKTIENEMRIQADHLLAEMNIEKDSVSISLCDEQWNEGLIGILASRLKENYAKTAFVFTLGANGDLKASARASLEVNLINALHDFNRHHGNILLTYGGHAKAAGLSIRQQHFDIFANGIETCIAKQLSGIVIDDAIYTDGELLPYELNIKNAEFLSMLEPWGSELPEPVFENTFYIDSVREVGKNHAQLGMIESVSGRVFKGIAFNQFSEYQSMIKMACRVAYKLSINEWRGERTLNLQIEFMMAQSQQLS